VAFEWFSLGLIQTAILVVVCAAAAATDLRTHRIPNWLTLPAMAIGLAMAGLPGWKSMVVCVVVVVAVLSVAIALHAVGVWGGGDGKLVGAVAALKGLTFVAEAMVWTFLIGGLVALCILIRKGSLIPTLRAIVSRDVSPLQPRRIAFGPLIAGGVAVALLTGYAGLRFFAHTPGQ
jgi:Flp pilus assembly protein protease CpaA